MDLHGIADPSPLLHGIRAYSGSKSTLARLPLATARSYTSVDTALERAEIQLSNAMSTSAWKLRSGEWSVYMHEL